jgi:hypothetical protein
MKMCLKARQLHDADHLPLPLLLLLLLLLQCLPTRCLASLARFKELAPRLLDRLLMAAVVAQPAAVLEGYAGAHGAVSNQITQRISLFLISSCDCDINMT